MIELPIAIQYAKSDNKYNTSETLINLYPEKATNNALSNLVLKGTPGYELLDTISNENILGIYATSDTLYVVTNKHLYSYSNGFTLLGDVDFTSPVSFAYNGNQLVITAGDSYYYDGTTVQKITDAAYYTASMVTYQDGYFIFNREGTGQFFISDLYSVNFNALQYATAESSPDNLLAVKSDSKKLWLFGINTIEVWYNSGDVFPFTRLDGGILNIGILDKQTIQIVNNTVVFVGRDNIVYAIDGFQPIRISTSAIENVISQASSFFSSTYSYEGHQFYILSTDIATYVYDFATQVWHKRESNNLRWDILYIATLDDVIYGVSGFENLYKLSDDLVTENGTPIKREMTTVPITNKREYFTLNSVHLILEPTELQYDVDNNIYLQFSENGYDWSNVKETTLQTVGDRNKRVKWNRLGRHREVMIKIFTYSPAKFRFMKLYGEVT